MDIAKRVPFLTRNYPYYLLGQFKRALTSAILNLSEGNGRTSIKERNRFFDISLGSISETIACVDIFEAFKEIPAELSAKISSDLKIAYVMIRNLKLKNSGSVL